MNFYILEKYKNNETVRYNSRDTAFELMLPIFNPIKDGLYLQMHQDGIKNHNASKLKYMTRNIWNENRFY